MRYHVLKLWPEFYDVLKSGVKTFEVRKNDRQFQTGDRVTFMAVRADDHNQVDNALEPFTRQITFVLAGGQFGIDPGYAVLALSRLPDDE